MLNGIIMVLKVLDWNYRVEGLPNERWLDLQFSTNYIKVNVH